MIFRISWYNIVMNYSIIYNWYNVVLEHSWTQHLHIYYIFRKSIFQNRLYTQKMFKCFLILLLKVRLSIKFWYSTGIEFQSATPQ